MNLAPLLKPFLSRDSHRPVLQRYWLTRGKFAACNGRMIYTFPSAGNDCPDAISEGIPPLHAFPLDPATWTGPALEVPPDWQARSTKVVECPRCRSAGSFTCRHCDQTEDPCSKCDGHGTLPNHEPVPLRHADDAARYTPISSIQLRTIATLEGVTLHTVDPVEGFHIGFRTPDGGIGIATVSHYIDGEGEPLHRDDIAKIIKRFWP